MQIDVFIEGKEIDLICLNETLAVNSQWYQWFNDEKVTAFMQKHYYPNTKELQKIAPKLFLLDNFLGAA